MTNSQKSVLWSLAAEGGASNRTSRSGYSSLIRQGLAVDARGLVRPTRRGIESLRRDLDNYVRLARKVNQTGFPHIAEFISWRQAILDQYSAE
jgi:hypothetical protein